MAQAGFTPEYVQSQSGGQGGGSFPGTGSNRPSGSGGGGGSLFGISSKLGQTPIILKSTAGQGKSTAPGSRVVRDPQASGFDQVTTVESALAIPYRMSPAEVVALQSQLIEAGMLNAKKITPGVLDDSTFSAYKDLVKAAAIGQRPIDEVLSERVKLQQQSDQAGGGGGGRGGRGSGGGGGGAGPPVIQLTHPDTLKAAFDRVGQEVIGRKLNGTELGTLVDAFHRMEVDRVSAVSSGASQVTDVPNVQAFATDQLRRTNPQGAAEMDWVRTGNAFLDLLRGQ